MNAAMTTGNDIRITHVVDSERCPRCEWRFIAREGDTHCLDCTNNPLWDREEDEMLAPRKDIFEFMGWRFTIKEAHSYNESLPLTYVMCWKRLFNPENKGEVYSQANFSHGSYDTVLYRDMPDRLKLHRTKEACAWLIAHWWEHYLEICHCLHGERDDQEDSNFRRAVIQSLLWYSENLPGE
jgi:hypothetical protein